jgi:hypothetical protein
VQLRNVVVSLMCDFEEARQVIQREADSDRDDGGERRAKRPGDEQYDTQARAVTTNKVE